MSEQTIYQHHTSVSPNPERCQAVVSRTPHDWVQCRRVPFRTGLCLQHWTQLSKRGFVSVSDQTPTTLIVEMTIGAVQEDAGEAVVARTSKGGVRSEAKEWGDKFRGKMSGGDRVLLIWGEIQRAASFFLFRLPLEHKETLNLKYDEYRDRDAYVFAARFPDGSWMLGEKCGVAECLTRAKVASKKQIALLEQWYGGM